MNKLKIYYSTIYFLKDLFTVCSVGAFFSIPFILFSKDPHFKLIDILLFLFIFIDVTKNLIYINVTNADGCTKFGVFMISMFLGVYSFIVLILNIFGFNLIAYILNILLNYLLVKMVKFNLKDLLNFKKLLNPINILEYSPYISIILSIYSIYNLLI